MQDQSGQRRDLVMITLEMNPDGSRQYLHLTDQDVPVAFDHHPAMRCVVSIDQDEELLLLIGQVPADDAAPSLEQVE